MLNKLKLLLQNTVNSKYSMGLKLEDITCNGATFNLIFRVRYKRSIVVYQRLRHVDLLLILNMPY